MSFLLKRRSNMERRIVYTRLTDEYSSLRRLTSLAFANIKLPLRIGNRLQLVRASNYPVTPAPQPLYEARQLPQLVHLRILMPEASAFESTHEHGRLAAPNILRQPDRDRPELDPAILRHVRNVPSPLPTAARDSGIGCDAP